MARTLSAKKRTRQNIKRKLRNQIVKSQIKTHLKKTRLFLQQQTPNITKDLISKGLEQTYKLIDKAVSNGVIHKNKAGRLKSRITLVANKVSQKLNTNKTE
ncbi:MAG: 30S ribosomal protein S20 [Planctomycetota bacterium]|nr:30S ribosomal protein S20 [Planctomycetota bacterium]MDI6787272.1 30S ribosomal protein S20 [Planctomycetota bacterium]